jgi:D-glycero-alpha-D-manno-heptose-7-phosphate kinase
MIHFSSSPLRISLIGGGTDFQSFYNLHGGAVINFTINKYVNVLIKNKFDKNIKLSYSINEYPKSVREIKHSLIKNIFKFYNIKNNIELVSIADIHSRGSGLGSSSAFTLATLSSINSFLNKKPFTKKTLAELACNIEIYKNKSPIGMQDQYSSCYGGFNYINFSKKKISVDEIKLSSYELSKIKSNLLLYNTGISRSANKILSVHKNKIKNKINIDYLKYLRDEAIILNEHLNKKNFHQIPISLNKSWDLKQKFNSKTKNPKINKLIEQGIRYGAEAGKLLGAGGGGFILFYVKANKSKYFKKIMGINNFIDFNFDTKGTQLKKIL